MTGGIGALRASTPMPIMPPLVLFVVECSEGQDVEKEQRSSNSDGDTQLGRVVTLLHQERLVVVLILVCILCLSGERCGKGPLGVGWHLLGSPWRLVWCRHLGGGAGG